MEWLKARRRLILNAAIGIATVGIIAFRYLSNDISSSTQEAESLYDQWAQDPQTDEETLLELERSKLTSQLSAHVAQRLLLLGEGEKALSFAQVPLSHLKGALPDYAEFSEQGLLIASGHLKEAFSRAVNLKEVLQTHGQSESLLYAYQLIRLKSLAKALRQDDLGTTKELDSFFSTHLHAAQALGKAMPN